MNSGRLDEALEAFRKAETLDLLRPFPHGGLWLLFSLREDWEQAEQEAKWLAGHEGERFKMMGNIYLATAWLYRGRARDGLRLIEQSARSSKADVHRGFLHSRSAFVLLEQGNPAKALEQAQKARSEGKGNLPEWEGLFVSSLALAKLGRWEDAEKIAETFRLKAEALPTQKEKRRYRHLMGELALARGQAEKSIEELEQSRSMLTARGLNWWELIKPQHVPIWYSLARAHLKAGNEERAAEWFQSITESTTEHIYWPIPYIRSFYFLGTIYEKRGEMDKAREYYRRFYECWKDGDIDHERVQEAKGKLGIT
jgi:tetratricopeptide (TPR) repeat protein